MEQEDQKHLIQFVLFTPMFIHPVTPECVVSFINGFELGKSSKDFSIKLIDHLVSKYETTYSNDGWPGQVERLSIKQSFSWIKTFKRVAAEVLLKSNEISALDDSKLEFKRALLNLSKEINEGNSAHLERKLQDWEIFYFKGTSWFEDLWTENERAILSETEAYLQVKNYINKKAVD